MTNLSGGEKALFWRSWGLEGSLENLLISTMDLNETAQGSSRSGKRNIAWRKDQLENWECITRVIGRNWGFANNRLTLG